MVGMECRDINGSGYCSQIRLLCAKIEYKEKRNDCEPRKPLGPRCTDKTLNNGQPWSDIDIKMCYDYSRWNCSTYGDGFGKVYTVNEACCECGGGDRS